MNNFYEAFLKLTRDIDIATAINVLKDSIPEDFWGSLTINELVDVYKTANYFPDIRQQSFIHLEKINADFKTWDKITSTYGLFPELDSLVFYKMSNEAKTFDQYLRSENKYMSIKKDKVISNRNIDEMFKLAMIFDDWHWVHIFSNDNSKRKIITEEKMFKLAQNYHHRVILNTIKPNQETLDAVICIVNSNPNDSSKIWKEIYNKTNISKELREYSLNKIIMSN